MRSEHADTHYEICGGTRCPCYREGQTVAAAEQLLAEVEDVLAQVVSRMARIERRLDRMSDVQAKIDADVASLTAALAEFGSEWQALSGRLSQLLAIGAPAGQIASELDTSKLDALAAQAQEMSSAWQAQVSADGGDASAGTPDETSAAAGTSPPSVPGGSGPAVAPSDAGAATQTDTSAADTAKTATTGVQGT